jgi:hypothetical protein
MFSLQNHVQKSMDTNTNETFRSEDDKGQISREVYQSRAGGDDALRYIKRDLLRDTLREDACLSLKLS